jgi:uncharacterized membrane protein
MELEKIFGLPAHPFLVHAPVVLIPLAGIIAIVFAFKPAWLDRFGWGLVALSGVGALGGILAASSGEGLVSLQNQAETSAREDHFELGQTAEVLGIVFFGIVLVVVLARHLARKKAATDGVWSVLNGKGAAIVMSVLLVASAAAATVTISQAGHQGAKLVWEDNGKSESDTGDGD